MLKTGDKVTINGEEMTFAADPTVLLFRQPKPIVVVEGTLTSTTYPHPGETFAVPLYLIPDNEG